MGIRGSFYFVSLFNFQLLSFKDLFSLLFVRGPALSVGGRSPVLRERMGASCERSEPCQPIAKPRTVGGYDSPYWMSGCPSAKSDSVGPPPAKFVRLTKTGATWTGATDPLLASRTHFLWQTKGAGRTATTVIGSPFRHLQGPQEPSTLCKMGCCLIAPFTHFSILRVFVAMKKLVYIRCKQHPS